MNKSRWHYVKKYIDDESGQSMVEYGLIIGILVVVIVGLLGGPMRETVVEMFELIKSKVIPALTGT